MNSITNRNKYIKCEGVVVSLKYAKTLFVIPEKDVEKFQDAGIEPKRKDFDGTITYSIAAKLQPEGVNSLYGALNLDQLVIGAKYSVVFKV
jgi:hypothetical protein